MANEVTLRNLSSRDLPFVTNSWLRNYRKSWHVKGVDNETYYDRHHRILEVILPRASTVVACHPQDPDVIFGWACAEFINESFVLHFVYVKNNFKTHFRNGEPEGFGIGTKLVEALLTNEEPERVIYTHETKQGKEFLKRLYQKGVLDVEPVYNPYILYETLPGDWSY